MKCLPKPGFLFFSLVICFITASEIIAQDKSSIEKRIINLNYLKPDLLTDSARLLLTEIRSLDDSFRESCFKNIYEITGSIKDPDIQTDLLNDLALYDSKNCLNYLHEVIRVSRENGLDNKLFWALNNIGYYYKSANRLDSAMVFGLQARALVAPKNAGEKVSITMLVADLYYWARMYDKAESLYKEVLILKGDSSQFRAWIYSTTNNNLGMIELNRKSFNKARDYFKASLKYKIENPFSEYDSVPIAFTYYLLGKTEFEAGNYEKSREYWNIGSPIADKFDIMEFVFYFSLLNARLLFTEGKIDQSYRELFRAFHLLERKNTNPLGVQESQPQIDADLLTIYDLFINIHSFQGKSDSMLYYYKLHQDLSYKLDMKSAYSAYIQMLAEKDIENMSTMLKKSNEQRKVYLAGLAILLLFLLIVLEYTRRIRIIRKKLSEKQAELLKTNEYLINLGKELQQSNTAKDKFFSVLAHDLKNPFNALKGFNELLAESIYLKDNDSSKIYADIIRYSTDNIYDLLINLLEWSKIHSGRITFSPEQVTIESLFNESVSKQGFQASHKQISLEVNFEPDAVMICDRYMMLSIIRNILSNAIRLTPDKGKISISYYKKVDKHQISITDTGPGMCPDLIEKVFGKGKSVDVPGDKKNSDRGLGIIIVKDFLYFHKGTIEVISELGMGCNVIIQIPAYQ